MMATMATEDLIGTRIAKRRHQLGLTQAELAVRVGVSKKTVSMWETDGHYPQRYLGKLEEVLGIPLTGPGPDRREEELRAALERLASGENPLINEDDVKFLLERKYGGARERAS
jgi:transcriptional regulator with XRE-family HTH domain